MNTEILKKLLDAAVASVRPADPHDPKDQVSALVKEVLRRPSAERMTELVSHLKREPELERFGDGHILIIPSSHIPPSFRYDNLALCLVRRALKVGSDQAIDNLNRYLHSTTVPYDLVIMFYGFKVEEPFKLENNIILTPPSQIPDSMENRRIQNLRSVDEGIIDKPDGSIILKYDHPIEQIPYKTIDKRKQNELNEKRRENYLKPVDALLCLSIASRSYTEVIGYWYAPDEWVPVPYEIPPGSLSPGTFRQRIHIPQKLEPEVLQRGKILYANFLELNQNNKNRLRIALERTNWAMGDDSLEDRAIDLGIAMEALFLPREDKELGYKVGTRAAWLLGNRDPKKRETLYNLFKKLYDMRSHAVHIGKVKDKYGEWNSRTLLQNGIDEMCNALEIVISRGHIEWDPLVLDISPSTPSPDPAVNPSPPSATGSEPAPA